MRKRYTDQACWGTPVHAWCPLEPDLPYEGVHRLEPVQRGDLGYLRERYIQSRDTPERAESDSSVLADAFKDKCSTADGSETSIYNLMPKVLKANEDVSGYEPRYSVPTYKLTAEDVDPYLRRESLTEDIYSNSDHTDDFDSTKSTNGSETSVERDFDLQDYQLTAEDVDPYFREGFTESGDSQRPTSYDNTYPADNHPLDLYVEKDSPHHEDAPPSASKTSKPKQIQHGLSDKKRFARIAANFMYVNREENENKLGVDSSQSKKSTAKVVIRGSTADSVEHSLRDNSLSRAWLSRGQCINQRTSDFASNLGNRDSVNSEGISQRYNLEKAVKKFTLDDVDPYLRDA